MKRCPFSFPFSVIWLKGAMHIFSYHTKGSAVLYIEEQASHWMRYVYHLLPQCLRKHWVCFFLIETAEKIGWVYHVRFIHCVSGRGVCFHAVHQNPLQTISWIMQRLRWKYSLRHSPPPAGWISKEFAFQPVIFMWIASDSTNLSTPVCLVIRVLELYS